ncbi:MAG: response regulator [Bacteroidetes bacterium]|nr:MAG: response regulator [Bacteroidota bacterium]
MDNNQRILIVDDRESNLFALKNILSDLDVEIVQAKTANEALIATLNYDFALAILDVQMPDTDGYELAELIRGETKTKYLPIIFLSAMVSDEFHIFKGYQSGGIDFITKPFKPEFLLSKVRVFLDLDKQKKELQMAFGKVNALNEQMQSQMQSLEQKNKEVSIKNKSLTANLDYAKRIQDAMLSPYRALLKEFPESFIFFKPKEAVSGDFYWFTKKNDKHIIAAVDCTGHGVPGAFMSVIGIELLRETINSNGITSPDEILDHLHQGIEDVLSQDATYIQDGMDISICVLDLKENVLEFAGARSPLYFIKDGKLEVIKGDKMPVGGSWNKKFKRTFSKKTMILDRSSTNYFYLSSDGYEDQFGELTKKKFSKEKFSELIVNIHELSGNAQRNILEKTMNEFMGKQNQVDDMLVIGFKI